MYEGLKNKLSELYNISATSLEPVAKGYLSINFVAHSPDRKYFLKKYRLDAEDKIKEIHAVKKFFADGGIPVIKPIPTNTGNTYFNYDNGFYTLFPFIDGIQYERNTVSDKAIASLAEMCARIHLKGKENPPHVSDTFKKWNKDASLEKIEKILEVISNIKEKTEFDELALESCLLKKKLIQENTISFEDLGFKYDHLIHGDYLDHNTFFNEKDEIIAVFDFEKADMSPREYEIFRSCMLTFLQGKNPELELKNVTTYLKAYHSVYPLTKQQIKNGLELFFQKQVHGVWVESEHYLKNSTRTDVFLKIEFDRLKYMVENKDNIVDIINLQ